MIVKGIDTIEFGIDIFDYFSSFENILYECKQLKAEAQETGLESEICLNDVNMKVHRNGIPFYAYKLTCNDFSICLMDKEINGNPPVKVRFMSSYLWSYGFEESFRLFCEWFENAFEHSINATRISRLDICMDSDEISFCESDIKGIVTRAHGMTKFFVSDEFHEGRLFSGFTIGRGDPILLRH